MSVTAGQVKELREKTGVGMMECKKALTENGGDIEKAILWLRERGMSRAAKKASRVAAEGLVKVAIADDHKTAILLEVNCETDFAAKNTDFQSFVSDAAKVALENKTPSIEALSEMKMPSGDNVADALTALIAKVGENMKLRRVGLMTSDSGIVTGYSHMGGKIGALVALDKTDASLAEMGKDLAMHVAASAPKYLKSDEVAASEIEQEKELARKKLEEQGKPADLIDKIMMGQMNKFFKEICFVDQAFIKDPNLSVSKLVKEQGKGAEIQGFTRFALGEGIEKKEENFADEVAAAVKGS